AGNDDRAVRTGARRVQVRQSEGRSARGEERDAVARQMASVAAWAPSAGDDEVSDFPGGLVDPHAELPATAELHVHRKVIDTGDRVQIEQELLRRNPLASR